jgi:hypothetical protein
MLPPSTAVEAGLAADGEAAAEAGAVDAAAALGEAC